MSDLKLEHGKVMKYLTKKGSESKNIPKRIIALDRKGNSIGAGIPFIMTQNLKEF